MWRGRPHALLYGATMSSVFGFSTGAIAQTQTAAGATQLEEIVVTAQKREESVQKVAASVTVVDAEALVSRGVVDLRGLEGFLPMTELNMEDTTTKIFMRGIGQASDADTNSPAVAVNIDGIYAPRFALGQSLFDVSQVNVLYGPQGTLYGRNAAGGAINVTTKVPVDHLESDGFLEVGNYATVHVFDAVNFPLSSDLFVRVAIDSNHHSGYLTDGQDDLDTNAGRIVALYKPTDNFTAILRGEIQNAGGSGSGVILTPLLDPKNPWYQVAPPGEDFFNKLRVYKGSGEFKYDVGGAQNIVLTYIPAYTYFHAAYKVPIGQAEAYYPDPGTPGNPLSGFAASLLVPGDTGKQVTNEFRVNGSSEKLKWVVGLYQLHFGVGGPGLADFEIDNPGAFAGGPAQPYSFTTGGGATYDAVTNDAYAAFGETTYSVLSNFRLTAGLRYSYDEQRTNGITQAAIPIANLVLPPSPYNLAQAEHRLDWKIGAEGDLSSTSMAYAYVQTGFIDGGFNIDAATASASTFRPETLLAYTAGIKNRFLDNSLQFNAEAFYYRYNDLQISAYDVANGANDEYNVPRSTIYGLQLDTIYRVFAHTTFDASLGLLHAVIDSATLPPAAIYSCGVAGAIPANLCSPNSLINYSGTTLPNAPRVSGSFGLSQQWDVANGGFLEGRVATHYEGSTWGLFDHLSGFQTKAYTKTDLSLTYHEPHDHWDVGLWVKNVENSAVYVSGATTSYYGLQSWFLQPPRTFGARIGYKFD
jgi:iron complex outermembrane recepter protein